MSKNAGDNYLDYVPMHNPNVKFEIDSNSQVTILRENKGVFDKVFQVLLKKPKVSQIHLDDMGNFIWPLIDGKRSIMDISLLVKANFGEKAEPLYDRLVTYIKMLETYGFILIIKD